MISFHQDAKCTSASTRIVHTDNQCLDAKAETRSSCCWTHNHSRLRASHRIRSKLCKNLVSTELRGCDSSTTKYVEKLAVKSQHTSSARSFRPSSNKLRAGFCFQSELREMYRIWCRLYLRQTVSKHLARSYLNEFHFWSRTHTVV